MLSEAAPRLLVTTSGATIQDAAGLVEQVLMRTRCLRIDNRRLLGTDRSNQVRLDALIGRALASSSDVQMLFSHDCDQHSSLYVTARMVGDEQVMLVLREVRREPVRLPDLTQLFALTHAEQEVVTKLANGVSVAEIAKSQGKSELTVRTHLKHSYAKMGIRTKEQLFGKLLHLMV